jgi:hypothetical protein
MAESIGDLLPQDRFHEPPEVQVIKSFVLEHFRQPVSVTVQPTQLVIHVKSAALAGALRVHLHTLKQLCQTEKRLLIRIG